MTITATRTIGASDLRFETGKLANLSAGSAVATIG